MVPQCNQTCDYIDCAADRGITPCWRETCDDFCGNKNCSIWYQQNSKWVGETCDDDLGIPDFRY